MVAEMLICFDVMLDLLAGHTLGLGGEIENVLGYLQLLRQDDQRADQLENVVVGQRAHVRLHAEIEARVQLIASDLGKVVTLGIEEERLDQRL